jgi:hypothetical protein
VLLATTTPSDFLNALSFASKTNEKHENENNTKSIQNNKKKPPVSLSDPEETPGVLPLDKLSRKNRKNALNPSESKTTVVGGTTPVLVQANVADLRHNAPSSAALISKRSGTSFFSIKRLMSSTSTANSEKLFSGTTWVLPI